jgi:hypothetical protein
MEQVGSQSLQTSIVAIAMEQIGSQSLQTGIVALEHMASQSLQTSCMLMNLPGDSRYVLFRLTHARFLDRMVYI